jgi:hypothetical protein
MDIERVKKILKKHFDYDLTINKRIDLKPLKLDKLEILRMLYLAKHLGDGGFYFGYENSSYKRKNPNYHDSNQFVNIKEMILNKKINFNELKEILINELFETNTLKSCQKSESLVFFTINNKRTNIWNFSLSFIISNNNLISKKFLFSDKDISALLKKWEKIIPNYDFDRPVIPHKVFISIMNEI